MDREGNIACFKWSHHMLLVDIHTEIQIPGGYIEQYRPEDIQFKSRGYDSYFQQFFGRYSGLQAFGRYVISMTSTWNNVK